jgi:hypothetical protein
MTTPDELLQRVLGAVDDASFWLVYTPFEAHDKWLEDFAERRRAL